MKLLMTTILAGLMTLTLIFACSKKEDYMGDGVITGFDPRDCACCGGLLINLNSNSTELFTDSTYQVDLVPNDFYIDADTGFPVMIRLDYSRNSKKCSKTIDILRFERK